MLSQKQTLIAGAVLGMLGVALGAFGAHALKATLSANGRLDTYELAVRYQFYHALALLFLGLWMQHTQINSFQIASLLFLTGTLFFSGSLYLLALTSATTFAYFTPVGGLLLLAGWIFSLIGFLKS